jgi:hypothetical protein
MLIVFSIKEKVLKWESGGKIYEEASDELFEELKKKWVK